ncbi:uncharacterized protein CLUP02_14599 [Colletotrichum lupini]|uniref:Uncharacterized protein n=1 Tax=Colletotrichum lupini TaxID=145971 RepID=A0A9Q8T4I2_9PEZI|nr:uncharacterized protein CLUP02_14599 [Colletotrichum lupini]UQC89071.1 hypothetical protein CLUP02_14599 [Colletotrichum lupini]
MIDGSGGDGLPTCGCQGRTCSFGSSKAGNQGQDPWLVPGRDGRSLVSTLIRPGRLERWERMDGWRGISQPQCIRDRLEVSGPLATVGSRDIQSFGVEPGRLCASGRSVCMFLLSLLSLAEGMT